MKEADSWKTFERTGSVKDYLQYKSSVNGITKEHTVSKSSVRERMEPKKKEASSSCILERTDSGM